MVQLSHPYMTTGKNITLTLKNFFGKVMSLLFNTLSSFFIAFPPWSKQLNFVAVVTIHSDFGAQENEICHCLHFFLSTCHEMIGPDAMILVFWMLSFKPAFSLSSFTFIKRLYFLFTFCVRVISSAYLRLLIFLPAILIPACASPSPGFHMMYSAYKLNKQGDNIQSWHTSFPILTQSVVPCPVLNVASWLAYRFLRRQVRWSGIIS